MTENSWNSLQERWTSRNLKWLNSVWNDACQPPSDLPIYTWSQEEITELPGVYAEPGPFDYTHVPFIKEPMDSLRNHWCREVVCQCSVQSLKTLIGELFLLWTIAENSGPTQWLQKTNDDAKDHCKERFNPLMDACEKVKRYYTENRHDKTTTRVIFSHMFLAMEGAETLRNLQRKSIKTQICSEVWQWKGGHLAEAAARLTQFTFNSKRYIESQPGEVDDDMDQAYKRGSQKVWHVPCPSCRKFFDFKWTHLRKDGTRGGMKWEESPKTRHESGEWRWRDLEQSVRYECPHCAFAIHDDAAVRHKLNVTGKFIAQNPDAPASIESYNWNQLTVEKLSWFSMVKKFLEAREQYNRGFEEEQVKFFQKVVGEVHDPSKFLTLKRLPTIEVVSEDKPLENESYRFQLVDVQAGHFWVLIQCWSDNGDSLDLFFDRADTYTDLYDLQTRYRVPAPCVHVDSGFETRIVYSECCRYGWTALKGEDRRDFIYVPEQGPKRGTRIRRLFSWPPTVGDGGLGKEGERLECPVILWSNPSIKDIAARRRDGQVKGLTVKTSEDIGDEFHKHMYSERRVRKIDNRNREQWVWERIGKRPNHGWDCYCMGIVAAAIAEILNFDSAD